MEFYKNKSKKLPDPFIIFRGGGYDGCFWQWDVYTPSYGGETGGRGYNAGDFKKLYSKSPLQAARLALSDQGMIVRTVGAWEKAQEEYSGDLCRRIAIHLDLEMKCPVCGQWHSQEYMVALGYHGCGGIATQVDDVMCLECADENSRENLEKEWKDGDLRDRLFWFRNSYPEDSNVFCIRRDEIPSDILYGARFDYY